MKTGLKTEVSKYIFLLIILSNFDLPAQIPLNGFCRYNNYYSEAGFRQLLAMNYNNDAYTDLLLFTSGNKELLLIDGDAGGTFASQRKLKFNHPVTAVRNLSIDKGYYRSYIIVSRKGRTASVINFNEDGRIFLLDEIRFDSYPENIDIADVTLDGSPDVLISGSGFNGISILHIQKGLIKETRVLTGTPFRNAIFTDFNNDGYQDITAVNLFEKRLDFYFNNSRGRFSLSKFVPLSNLPYTLNSTDIDLDYFEDIIWSEKGKITILYGDEYASHSDSYELLTRYDPHIFITGDFNKDGNIDIAYADTTEGIVSVFFAGEDRQFSEEHLLMKKNNITSLIPFYSRFITGLAAYSSSGNVYTVTQMLSLGDEVNITAGIKPGALNHFDYLGNGINDIAYIDEEESVLNLLVRNNSGIPDKLYKFNLHYPHKQITVDNTSKEVIVFYCWTRGEKLIEIVNADFKSNILKRTSLYSTEKIHDLKIKTLNDKPAVIYASYIKDGTAGANVFEFFDFRYIRNDYYAFALNVEDISPSLTTREEGFFTWQRRKSLNLYYHNIRNLPESKKIGEVKNGEQIISITTDVLNNDSPSLLAFIQGSSAFIASGGVMNKVNADQFHVTDKNQVWTGEIKVGGLKRIFAYLPEKRSLNRITLFNRGKNLILSELISEINVNRYFVKNMGVSDYHIVYSDSVEKCITIKRIK